MSPHLYHLLIRERRVERRRRAATSMFDRDRSPREPQASPRRLPPAMVRPRLRPMAARPGSSRGHVAGTRPHDRPRRCAYLLPSSATPPDSHRGAHRATQHDMGEHDRIAAGEPDRVRSGARIYRLIVMTAWIVASVLPLVGLVSLFLRRQLDPAWDSPRLHFVLFLAIGGGAFMLAYLAGQAADRRGDARVFLLSLAFLATGGFLAVHAVGTPGILLNNELPGFKVAIPAGMVIGALFACASAFVDVRPRAALAVVRHRNALRRSVFAALAIWSLLSLAELPPLAGANAEGGGTFLRILAAIGAVVYGVSAIRYVVAFRGRMTLLPASVVASSCLSARRWSAPRWSASAPGTRAGGSGTR